MKNLKDAKNVYDHIVVPEELDARLRSALEAAVPQKISTGRLIMFTKRASTVAAAVLICFTIGLNTSKSFAMEMSNVPLLRTIVKVLTIRSYETTEDTTTTRVEIPEVQVDTTDEDVSNAITDVNEKIRSLIDEYTAQKQAEIAEYKENFFEAGGTEEEWEERSIDVNVNYEIKHQSDTVLSLLIDSWISWFNFEEERTFYNIDLTTGKELTLVDILGEDAYTYATDCVLQQMHALIEKDPNTYTFWGVNDGDDTANEFPGVKEDTLFYMNESGNVVISYNKYEAAPGFLGIQEFEIPAR